MVLVTPMTKLLGIRVCVPVFMRIRTRTLTVSRPIVQGGMQWCETAQVVRAQADMHVGLVFHNLLPPFQRLAG